MSTDWEGRWSKVSGAKRDLLQRRLRGEAEGPAPDRIGRRPTDEPAPLSFAQERLWFLDRLAPGNPFYNVASAVRLGGRPDMVALGRTVRELVRRHEVLRTRFTAHHGQPVQVIGTGDDIAVQVLDVEPSAERSEDEQIAHLASSEAARPFDLERGPLLRVLVLRTQRGSVLVLVLHHIVCDGWSMNVLFEELGSLYEAFSAGAPSPLPDLDLQYADYAVWQRARLSGAAMERQLTYWRTRLQGLSTLQLTTDRPRPAVQRFRGRSTSVQFGAAWTADVRRLGHDHSTTPFMTLFAGFVAVLHRWTDQDDIVVGTPIAGRNRAELEQLIGFFVHSLVLRVDTTGDPSFRELLGRVRTVALGAYAHQDLPFESLVEDLRPPRDLSRNPLFQVMFQVQGALQAGRTAAVALEGDLRSAVSKFDLTFSFTDSDPLSATVEFDTDLFDPQTVDALCGQLEQLLAGAAADPDCPISRIPLLDDDEHRRLLSAGAATPRADRPGTVVDEFVAQAARSPEATAVVCGGDRLTYADLDRRANQLAHHLRARGAGTDVVVGIHVPRSAALVVAVLAVLKAGSAYLPLDPAYPAARIEQMLDDGRPELLITGGGVGDRLPPHPATTIDLELDAVTLAAGPTDQPASLPRSGHLAYVMYTSGSTGHPKGVQVEHGGLLNVLEAQRELFGTDGDDRVLQFSSLSFDASMFEMLIAWGAGAALVVAEGEALLLGDALTRLLREQEVGVVVLPPSILSTLDPDDLPRLRTVTVAGEACPPDLVARWAPGRRFFNLYGPTEATIWATARACSVGDDRVPIGRPIPHVACHVVDRQGQLVPWGVPGELWVGGAGVARGYLGRPELTAERFVTAASLGDGRFYRTGDRVRRLRNGELEFLGRIDDQVKVRGLRIEPAEIEAVLREHPGVREAAVGRPDRPEATLVGYVVGDADPQSLRRWVGEVLPAHMVPSTIGVVPALPRSPSGKLDRQALLASRPPGAVGPRTPPTTELEATIAAVWQEVLELDAVDVDQNFFDLGGHSLLMARVQARLQAELGRTVSIVDLFHRSTVRMLAAHLQAAEEPHQREPESAEHADDRRAVAQRAAMRRHAIATARRPK
jgi:amino acid adenylation domain-containing protein